MIYTFDGVVTGLKPVKSDSFEVAYRAMHGWVKKNLKTLSLQILETAIWIEVNNKGVKAPLDFYASRDEAYERGIIKKMKADGTF